MVTFNLVDLNQAFAAQDMRYTTIPFTLLSPSLMKCYQIPILSDILITFLVSPPESSVIRIRLLPRRHNGCSCSKSRYPYVSLNGCFLLLAPKILKSPSDRCNFKSGNCVHHDHLHLCVLNTPCKCPFFVQFGSGSRRSILCLSAS